MKTNINTKQEIIKMIDNAVYAKADRTVELFLYIRELIFTYSEIFDLIIRQYKPYNQDRSYAIYFKSNLTETEYEIKSLTEKELKEIFEYATDKFVINKEFYNKNNDERILKMLNKL